MSKNKRKQLSIDEHYVRPQASWEQMKAAKNIGQTVYIYGVTGTGKTSFAVDFLGRKRYQYVSVSDTGIEEIAAMVSEKTELQTTLVIDDLHLLETWEERSLYGQLIEELSVRKDVWLILISRASIPKWLKSVHIRHFFVTIGEEQLFLTEKEQEIYLEKWEVYPTEAASKRIRELGHGHPLYLQIAAMRLKGIPKFERTEDKEEAELHEIEESRKDIWDYFEVHVYDQWNVELQEFLESISIVEQFDLRTAQQITKKKNAGRLLVQALEMGNFLIEESENEQSVYEMRIPMKYSMRRRLFAKYSQDYIGELYYSAGNSYEMEGNIMEALKMYETCHNEEGISRILIENMN